MRTKIKPQGDLDFRPSNLKLTQEYYQQYEQIDRILDENPGILNAIHKDLEEPLKYEKAKGNDGREATFTSDNVVTFHGHVAGHLRHPLLVGMRRYTGDVYLPRRNLYEEQDVVSD